MKKLLIIVILFIGTIEFSIATNIFPFNLQNTALIFTQGPLISTTANLIAPHSPDATGVLFYSKELYEPSQIKNRLYNKTLLWFYKYFFNSYDKIITSDPKTGTIVGRAFFYSSYKVPDKADSTNGEDYTNYNFEWTAKIENYKIVFSIHNFFINKSTSVTVNIDQKIVVTKSTEIPFGILLKSNKKLERDWNLSKSYLIKNVDAMVATLNKELQTDNDLYWYF